MTDLQCFNQAIDDFEELSRLIKDKTYEQVVDEISNLGYSVNDYDELCDINYGTCCFTIRNENGKPILIEESIEIWNDSEYVCLGTYALKELKERG